MASSILISSCKKDEKNKNEFKFDGSTITLDKGFIEDYGENFDGSYDFDVWLFSENINFVDDELTGSGDGIYLDLNTADQTGLEEGTYIWSEDRAKFTIVDGGAILNADILMETGEEIIFTNGSVDISFDGDKTVLEFDMITEGNKTLTGKFKGVLEKI